MQPKSVWSKLPFALLAAAILFAAAGTARLKTDAQRSIVDQAIAARFHDVGIPPLSVRLAFWQSRVDADPADYLSRTNLASAIMADAKDTGDLSRYPVAEAILRQALTLNPGGSEAMLGLGAARAANHDFATSLKLAQQVLAKSPWSDAALIAVVDDNFELGNYDVARAKLDNLVLRLGSGPGIEGRLAKRAWIEGHNDEAVDYAARALLDVADLDLRPSEAAFYRFQLGSFLYKAGRISEALRALDAGLAIDPPHLASRELRASVLVALGRLDEAAAAYESILVATPAADLHGSLAKVYHALGRNAEAADQLAKGLTLGHHLLEQFPAERRHLAGFFADAEPATALRAALADFKSRQDVGAYDTLAWAYYRTGKFTEASRYLAGALAHGTREATLLYHAGMISAAVGEDARAVEMLRSALALNPGFDLDGARRARETLAQLGG